MVTQHGPVRNKGRAAADRDDQGCAPSHASVNVLDTARFRYTRRRRMPGTTFPRSAYAKPHPALADGPDEVASGTSQLEMSRYL